MTEEELKKKIAFQIGFVLFSGKTIDETVRDLMSITSDYTQSFKKKAEKWDKLSGKISECYVDENGDELSEEDSENIDLGTIGEIAASAFGWL